MCLEVSTSCGIKSPLFQWTVHEILKREILMRKRELERIKKELLRRKRELLGQALDVREGDLQTDRENLLDTGDVATQEVSQSFKIRIREREEKLLRKVDSALNRLEKGDFGICEECGEAIEVKRLVARPVTTFCIDCKNRQEEEEKS